MAAREPGVRSAAARIGGLARVAKADPDEMRRTRQAAAAAVNSPTALARRIVKAWPGLSRKERTEVREILAAVMPKVAGRRPID
jgi:hypothetical protein